MGTLYEVTGDLGSITKVLETKEQIIRPSTIDEDQDNYNPTGLATCNIIIVDSDQSREIRGLTAPAAGVNKVIWFFNSNTANRNLKFMHNDSSATAANRFLLRDNAAKDLKEGEGCGLWYDHDVDRWRPLTRLG